MLLIFYGNQIKKTTMIIIVLSTLKCVNKISTPFPIKKDAIYSSCFLKRNYQL
jgi:hypothetical protein